MRATLIVGIFFLPLSWNNAAEPQLPNDKKEPVAVKPWTPDEAVLAAGDLTAKVRRGEVEAIRFLESIPEQSKRDQQAGPAATMEFLGSIRSVKAVPILCDRLLWEKFHNGLVDYRLKYPASAALVQIGTPAVKALLTKVSGSDVGKEYRRVVIGVLVDVLGKDKVVKTINDFKIDDPANEVEGRKHLDTLSQEFKNLYKI